jgi:hypothetical protein
MGNWIPTCIRLKLNYCLSLCTKIQSKWINTTQYHGYKIVFHSVPQIILLDFSFALYWLIPLVCKYYAEDYWFYFNVNLLGTLLNTFIQQFHLKLKHRQLFLFKVWIYLSLFNYYRSFPFILLFCLGFCSFFVCFSQSAKGSSGARNEQ